jgi:expansin (peptidoglycan-binding protein)
MVAAMNHTDYADSAACGACVAIDGPQGSVGVRIVDRCPECAPGDIDLSPEAFAQIADLSAGRVDITWRYVSCEVSGPVVFHFKEGSNQWWTAVQLRNHRHAIASFAYQDEAGDFVAVERLDYNYFVASEGMGPGPYTFRVTDVLGNSLEQTGIAFAEAQDVSGDQQFPACEP